MGVVEWDGGAEGGQHPKIWGVTGEKMGGFHEMNATLRTKGGDHQTQKPSIRGPGTLRLIYGVPEPLNSYMGSHQPHNPTHGVLEPKNSR